MNAVIVSEFGVLEDAQLLASEETLETSEKSMAAALPIALHLFGARLVLSLKCTEKLKTCNLIKKINKCRQIYSKSVSF